MMETEEYVVRSLATGFVTTRTRQGKKTKHAFEEWDRLWEWINANMAYADHFKLIFIALEEEDAEGNSD